jgi:hypothetical protein
VKLKPESFFMETGSSRIIEYSVLLSPELHKFYDFSKQFLSTYDDIRISLFIRVDFRPLFLFVDVIFP